jgi:hypothetical protein
MSVFALISDRTNQAGPSCVLALRTSLEVKRVRVLTMSQEKGMEERSSGVEDLQPPELLCEVRVLLVQERLPSHPLRVVKMVHLCDATRKTPHPTHSLARANHHLPS